MNYRKANTISLIISFLGIAVAIIPFLISGNSSRVFLFAGLAVFIAGIITNRILCRCPVCGRFVNVDSISLPDYCPFCGEPLEQGNQDDDDDNKG